MTTLSGREAQRLALIRTTTIEIGLLLLDEPTANMDDTTQASAQRLMLEFLE